MKPRSRGPIFAVVLPHIDRSPRDLLAWFDARPRDLPWRRSADPYRVWVSEIMLQQTRVETVIPRYERWLERFPTVEDLAAADVDEVLAEWEGLGYYSRARNLHAAARVVRDSLGGAIPATARELRDLPGVGEYTAGAVASIAFDRPEPAIDTNARRVLSRLFDLETPGPARLRALAAELIPEDRPGDFNQALMELGATVCTPRSPRCGECPLADRCLALARGTVAERPGRSARPPTPRFELGVAVAQAPQGRVLLVRRAERGMLGGLWQFPARAAEAGETPLEAAAHALGALAPGASPARPLAVVAHAYSHRRHVYHAFLFRADTESVPDPATVAAAGWTAAAWEPPEASGRGLPAAQRRIARALVAASPC
ncbi:MAG TPA: A/G-specific adenine glycosylase [Gemmatimonadota bacterium]|nr:A/G-specific adenine glycosylase [Gemmatimonadota bacterium]